MIKKIKKKSTCTQDTCQNVHQSLSHILCPKVCSCIIYDRTKDKYIHKYYIDSKRLYLDRVLKVLEFFYEGPMKVSHCEKKMELWVDAPTTNYNA